MNRSLAIVCAIACVLAGAVGTAAETGARPGGPAPAGTGDMKGYVKLRGTIESLNAPGRKFTLRDLDGKATPLKAGKHVVLDNFQDGDAVKVDAKAGVAIIMTIDASRQKSGRPKSKFKGH